VVQFLNAAADELPATLQATVCIVGAGAAGITMARTLAGTGVDVLLVESGDMVMDGLTQGLFLGRQLGVPYFNLVSCRLRYFGGTTNHWGGYCRSNDPIDYEGRPELGLPQWPINQDDLAFYVTRAGDSLGLTNLHFSPRETVIESGLDAGTMVDDISSVLETKVIRIASRKRLGSEFKEELAAADNVRTILNLNVTHVQLNEEGTTVMHVDAKTLGGKTTRIQADRFVLCCHGIENPRLLMSSNDVQTNGIGNDNDLVGRYFMDHIHIFASRFIPSREFPRAYDFREALKYDLNANIGFKDDFLREKSLLQYYCRFNPIFVSDDTELALRNLKNNAMEPGNLSYLRDVATAMSEFTGAAKQTLKFADLLYSRPMYYELEHRLEQAPNPDSRVVLSNRLDALGNRIADLDWQINDLDVDTFQRGQVETGRELAALGWGRFEEETITRELVEKRIKGHYHQIGTTRMGNDPADSVVDRNCKVHSINNLYIGGSSVFPTAGYSGPTMVLIALAIRLAEHLKEDLQ